MGLNDVWECVQLLEIYNEQRCKRNKHITPNSYKFLEPFRKKNIYNSQHGKGYIGDADCDSYGP